MLDKLREFLLPRKQAHEETALDQAVRRELERHKVMNAVVQSSATAEPTPALADPPKKRLH